jgi:hypothetical protein
MAPMYRPIRTLLEGAGAFALCDTAIQFVIGNYTHAGVAALISAAALVPTLSEEFTGDPIYLFRKL